MGTGAFEKMFCKVCGVNVGNEAAPLSEEEAAALDPRMRGFYEMAKKMATMNVKVLDGFDLAQLKDATRAPEGAGTEPKYVNP